MVAIEKSSFASIYYIVVSEVPQLFPVADLGKHIPPFDSS